MLDRIARLFAPPVFSGDEEKTRAAGMVNTLLWICLATFAVSISAVPYAEATSHAGLSAAVVVGVLLMLATAGLILLHAGYVERVARSFALGLWIAVTLLVLLTGGVTSPETSGYLTVILAAGVLSGLRPMAVFSGLSLLTITVFFLAGAEGLLPAPVLPMTPINGFAAMAANVLVMAGVLYRSLRTLNEALADAHRSAGALAESNRALNDMHGSLERQVAERARGAEAAREEAEQARRRLEAQVWQSAGQAALNDCLRGEQDVPTLAGRVISQLCRYVDAPVGALYVLDGETLSLAGSYACAPAALRPIEPGEGLLGQAVLDRRALVVRDLPDDFLTVTSTLGRIAPRQVLIAPFVYDGQVVGAVEIGTLADLAPQQSEFIAGAMENVAIAFRSAQARARMDDLLVQTQQQAEELQAQEEELRAINEELQAQADSLRTPARRARGDPAGPIL